MTFNGPVEVEITGAVADDLLATLREALSNVARHAGASEVIVEVGAAIEAVVLRVRDNGQGIGDATDEGGRGLGNMRTRAERHGGQFAVITGTSGGTDLEWTVPVRR